MNTETKQPEVTFERVLRDCPHNAEGRKPAVYDFDVFIDDAKVATFNKRNYSRGYYLYDSSGAPIKCRFSDGTLHHSGVYAGKQADFTETVIRHLSSIPTTEQIEQWVREWREAAEREAAERAEAERIERIKEAGPELLAAIIELLRDAEAELKDSNAMRARDGWDVEPEYDSFAKARAAIAKATTE